VRILKKIFLCATIFVAVSLPLAAEERIALVVGNGSYGSVASLDNPVRDAALIASTLEALNFNVTLLSDADQIELKRAISQFGRELRASGTDTVGLFYYAGHGVQSFGTNYLLPVDASLTDAADLGLVALEASAVLRQMASAGNRTNIVILDACRNNPFERITSLDDNGLAEMKAPTGTYLAYATAPGAVALDGLRGNSPFTQALAAEMKRENLPIEQVFKNVRVKVISQTGGAQTPWDTSSLTSNFVFKAGILPTADEIAEQQLWRAVEVSRDPVQLMLFLRSYPEGQFREDARAMLSEVMQSELGESTTTVPEVVTEPEIEEPSDREAELIEVARSSGYMRNYEAYLAEFPAGVFAELAKLEIRTLRAEAETTAPVEKEPAQKAAVANPPAGVVLFNTPLIEGPNEIVGLTIEQLVAGTPLFSPIEGIPETLWKGKECSSCHAWTREALCTQATTYLSLSMQRSLSKEHPYGGVFKQNLKSWAAGGCE
jgi:uncharacterized caspase-like protein